MSRWAHCFSLLIAALLCATSPTIAATRYDAWRHSSALYLLTTPDGANLPTSATEKEFPLLVRLTQDSFDFSQAQTNGNDIRFSTATGASLPYQIDEWNAEKGTASIWVRIPTLNGNERQEIRLHWGNPDAASESNGTAVFNESNGYLSVWHMNDPVKDEVGTLRSENAGTTCSMGIVGPARHFAGDQGIFCGEKITTYPTGSSPHSSEAWFRTDKAKGNVIAWGNEERQGKLVMQLRNPPHVSMDCYFSDANVKGKSTLPLSEWIQVVHTYEKGNSRVYVNGVLDGVAKNQSATLDVKSPAKLWIGGWHNDYDFVGDIDEVRMSKVARSADWVKLQYENQKPLQTLVGLLVKPGSAFTVSPMHATVLEGKRVSFSAEADGAQKVYWILKSQGREKIVGADNFHLEFDAGRVMGDHSVSLQFKAIYASEVKTRDIPIAIKEDIQEPVFTLRSPGKWDGRSTIEVEAQVSNLSAMQAKGAGDLETSWRLDGISAIQEVAGRKLILRRAMNSGKLTVTATMHNGGTPTTNSVTIEVTEPKRDAWVARAPAQDEKPEDNQFYARDDKNEGTLFYNGTLREAADGVFLKVHADGKLSHTEHNQLTADKGYAFAVKLKPGLIRYKVEFGVIRGGQETVLHTATNLVCGDAYLIDGQSNAVATDWGKDEPTFRSEWIRTFGSMSGDSRGVTLWGEAVHRSRDETLQIGYWGMELARRLIEEHKIPICILNGAVGGTRIDQHQRNPKNAEDANTIYGRLLWRVKQARLTHGIRGVLWHQGENDQGADGPTGGFGWEKYRQYFFEMSAAWKQDYPNLHHYYLFQIWPKSCGMGINGSDNRLREVQRTLPKAFSNLSIMSTLGIEPPGGCHYPPAGYAEIARLICPLIERDNYGKSFNSSITPPNLECAYFASDKRDEVVMEFDQPVKWDNTLTKQFYLDGKGNNILSGTVSGKAIKLKLASPSTARQLTYLDSKSWSQNTLLRGENGIAALTFCDVAISAARPKR